MTDTPQAPDPDATEPIDTESADTEAADTEPADTELAGSASARRPAPVARTGDAVPEPIHELSAEMRAKMFKKPLDRVRRAPVSPFAPTGDAVPRGGVRPELPVRYPRRNEAALSSRGAAITANSIGAPPADSATEAVERGGLRSIDAQNKRFAMFAFVGGVAAIVGAGLGLWWIAAQLF